MPIYEYVCPKCGHKFEVFYRNIRVTYSHPCPECGTDSPKVFSTYNFQFSPFLQELCKGTII